MAEVSGTMEGFRNEILEDFNGVELLFYKASAGSKAIIYTKGLTNVNQHEVAEQTEHIYPFIELYFFLPSYWDLKKENQQWPITVLKRLIDAQKNKNAWFGPGDTLTAHPKAFLSEDVIDNGAIDGAEPKAINSIFKQTHLVLTDPIEAQSFLEAVTSEDEQHNWLAIVPIFEKEFEYKTSRSALELIMKFEKNKVTEELDEHRPIIAKKKFFGLF